MQANFVALAPYLAADIVDKFGVLRAATFGELGEIGLVFVKLPYLVGLFVGLPCVNIQILLLSKQTP